MNSDPFKKRHEAKCQNVNLMIEHKETKGRKAEKCNPMV